MDSSAYFVKTGLRPVSTIRPVILNEVKNLFSLVWIPRYARNDTIIILNLFWKEDDCDILLPVILNEVKNLFSFVWIPRSARNDTIIILNLFWKDTIYGKNEDDCDILLPVILNEVKNPFSFVWIPRYARNDTIIILNLFWKDAINRRLIFYFVHLSQILCKLYSQLPRNFSETLYQIASIGWLF